MPPPINSTWEVSRGDASASRGNHTRGTETTRPSVSVTESASIEHDTSTANVSVFSICFLLFSAGSQPLIVHQLDPVPLQRRARLACHQRFQLLLAALFQPRVRLPQSGSAPAPMAHQLGRAFP